ncbi:hypothetical protein A2316_04150 [Candidatus Falkowbacteria bacterium RIFOXYB2_FULL_38_15]|uniref:HTH arsR-type domain-containing protein n=1 Tax=Candidatus Falkowbacteria bacterium RIFOXYA2_FULL_38_12 TaxID=1797993 RepID=A0A1F5S266_9BACT|nr:MAG: hypothetical protein A2257_03295 [Candidatus Falkowbacteria bacterium RIFOXYA2_FULL_38_12]OGF33678.1 MAG: hypothetical protein A2316_04150 [Candidatus Falkowbacteria bacterium RIFOXYB2_FULL_38_15]OGF42039.1 MAG: hypothetical protein A2555_01410 [Candidatus Falkowbacteria bacterium RIFOXYD2_FULL_39_16]
MVSKTDKKKIDGGGLEQIFGSGTRVKLLKLFLNDPDKAYFVREISRIIGAQINSVRRELLNLKSLGIVSEVEWPENREYIVPVKERGKDNGSLKLKKISSVDVTKKFFQANKLFILFPELKALILKADFLLEKNLAKEIGKIGEVDYLALTGDFVGLSDAPVDLILVGKFNKKKLSDLIGDFEKDFGRAIDYTVMTRQEFNYRKDITDRFLYNILENKKIVMVNELDNSRLSRGDDVK